MLEQIQNRTNKVFVWFLVLMEIVSVSSLISIAHSRENFQNLSNGVTPDADILFDSMLLNIIVSDIFGYFLFLMLFIIILKEFLISQLKLRIYYNLGILSVLLVFIGFVFNAMYSPIL